MHHVIIGAGPAGVVAAENLRKLDPTAKISIYGAEREAPYSRMALPYFLIDKVPEEGAHLRKNDRHYDLLNIDVHQQRVDKINPASKSITLEDGSDVSYDKLLIASGSHPVRPPIAGMDLDKVYSCWTLEDGRAIAEKAKPGSTVVLMGAGFIGCIILEALALRGVELTVVEAENRMVPRMMNEISGGLIKRWCEDKGVNVRTSTRVEGIEEGSDKALKLNFNDGSDMQADVVICATGVKPNIGFLEGSGIKVDQGILVNPYLETSQPDIFAAGDVCQGLDFSTGDYAVQAIQPTAADHGLLVANNMVDGREQRHRGCVNMNVLDTMGLISASFGLWEGAGGDRAALEDYDNYRYLELQFEDDILVGANSLGLTQHVGVLRGLIQSRTRLGPWKEKLMNDPTRVMEAYLACAQAQA
ncbi:MAG: NAD(P)/FAD-dependent oxidoreductase [Granulosicoccaceae bacterium]